MKNLRLLLIISFHLMAICTTTTLVEGGENKHNHSNFMKKELEGMNNKGKKFSLAGRKEKNTERFSDPTSKFVYGDSKKKNNAVNDQVINKYYTDSIDDSYPSANGASIDSHHLVSIDQYRRIINNTPFHP